LFRGKRCDNGEWIEGSLVHQTLFYGDATDCYHILYGGEFHCDFYDAGEVIPKTVGQYTGLTDKNGKRIFEGDICRNTRTNEIVSVNWHGTMAGYGWSKRKTDGSFLYDFGALFRSYDKMEVIGNIHDNPELLEVDSRGKN
jgi:uncharacterized phage protein (TIGR01671 family)